MKKIYILLTRTHSIVSRTVHFITMDQYTHAAIAFDQDMEVLYSSARWDGKNMFPCGDVTHINICRFAARLDMEEIFFQKLRSAIET